MTNEHIEQWIKGAEAGMVQCAELTRKERAEWDVEKDGPYPEYTCHACDSDRIAIAAIRQLQKEITKLTNSGE